MKDSLMVYVLLHPLAEMTTIFLVLACRHTLYTIPELLDFSRLSILVIFFFTDCVPKLIS